MSSHAITPVAQATGVYFLQRRTAPKGFRLMSSRLLIGADALQLEHADFIQFS
jgi:hypothetical protein